MLAFGLFQTQGAGEGVEHRGTGPGLLAAFQAGVVVDADAGEGGQFLTAQTGCAAQSRADRETGLGGGGPDPADAQEAAQLGAPRRWAAHVSCLRVCGPG
ncbi:hypothetical protein GCM10022233_57620 [Streptomyces shaanxiensis]|uniref:Uncharacterized protein n=1 Tax=Streptomyces shaanxiensis TaxID=653357 RepID=A0ABP7VRF5_9ACTN